MAYLFLCHMSSATHNFQEDKKTTEDEIIQCRLPRRIVRLSGIKSVTCGRYVPEWPPQCSGIGGNNKTEWVVTLLRNTQLEWHIKYY